MMVPDSQSRLEAAMVELQNIIVRKHSCFSDKRFLFRFYHEKSRETINKGTSFLQNECAEDPEADTALVTEATALIDESAAAPTDPATASAGATV
jgi:hypothetical protein